MRKWSTQYPLHAAGNKFFLSCLYHTHTLIIPLLLKLWEICTSSLHNCQTFWTFLKILSGQFQDDCEACRAVSICWTGLCIHGPSRLGRVPRERIFGNYWSRFVQASDAFCWPTISINVLTGTQCTDNNLILSWSTNYCIAGGKMSEGDAKIQNMVRKSLQFINGDIMETVQGTSLKRTLASSP